MKIIESVLILSINIMAMNKPQVDSIPSLKTRREYIHVALVTASLLPTALKNSMETSLEMISLFLVHSHNKY